MCKFKTLWISVLMLKKRPGDYSIMFNNVYVIIRLLHSIHSSIAIKLIA